FHVTGVQTCALPICPDPVSLETPGGATVPAGCFTWADTTIADEQYIVKMPPNQKKDVTAIIGCAVMTGAGAVYHTAGVKKGQSEIGRASCRERGETA